MQRWGSGTDPTTAAGTGAIAPVQDPELATMPGYSGGGTGSVAENADDLETHAKVFDPMVEAVNTARQHMDDIAKAGTNGIKAGNFPQALALGKTVVDQATHYSKVLAALSAALSDNQAQLRAFSQTIRDADNATGVTAADLAKAFSSTATKLNTLAGVASQGSGTPA
ncbi:hypothetical protein ACFXKI_44320 [Streptomyces mirabilis]|uniref:hypothetical protein n=1 Tax=Streptomyces mirabilis TaxID=68239 RepID=UPI00366A50DC